jgi:hypothetical protein
MLVSFRTTTHRHCQKPDRPTLRGRGSTTERNLPTLNLAIHAEHTEFGNSCSPPKHNPNWQGNWRKGREPGRGGDKPQTRMKRSRHAEWPSTIHVLQMSNQASRKTSMRLLAERTESRKMDWPTPEVCSNDHWRQSCSETKEVHNCSRAWRAGQYTDSLVHASHGAGNVSRNQTALNLVPCHKIE